MPVVVGYLPTPESAAALRAAAQEAADRHTRLVVAAHGIADASGGVEFTKTADLPALPFEGDIVVRGPVSTDETAADQILRVAEEDHAELVVLGLRRKARTGRMTIGASAQRVILESPCPVLATKFH